MVLHHIPQRASALVVAGSILDAELLAGRNLDVIDVSMVSEGLK